jgi:hypothetical protein
MISGIVIRLTVSGLAGNVPGAIGLCLSSDVGQGGGDAPPTALFVFENGQTLRLDWPQFHRNAAVVGFLDELCGLFSPDHLIAMSAEAFRTTFGSYFAREWPATPRRHSPFSA